jgi:hypothetical protein
VRRAFLTDREGDDLLKSCQPFRLVRRWISSGNTVDNPKPLSILTGIESFLIGFPDQENSFLRGLSALSEAGG